MYNIDQSTVIFYFRLKEKAITSVNVFLFLHKTRFFMTISENAYVISFFFLLSLFYLIKKINYRCCNRFFFRTFSVLSLINDDDDDDVFSFISDVFKCTRFGITGIKIISFGRFVLVFVGEKGVDSVGRDFISTGRLCFLEHQYI